MPVAFGALPRPDQLELEPLGENPLCRLVGLELLSGLLPPPATERIAGPAGPAARLFCPWP